jgi:hypothetical protein
MWKKTYDIRTQKPEYATKRRKNYNSKITGQTYVHTMKKQAVINRLATT